MKRHETAPKQAVAAAILAGGGTNAEAAAAAGVHLRTVARWRTDAAFMADVRRLTAGALDTASRVLAGGAANAARYLVSVADGTAEGDAHRVNAARLVLTMAPTLRDAVELEARLSALEVAAGIAPPPTQGDGPRLAA